ncbi:MAG: hypothetical protein ACXWQZ_08955 [Ktedonobacterales bacterium]
MFTDPTMSSRLAEEHRCDLLREAARERLARQARTDQPAPFTHVRLRASALLFALGRLLQLRELRPARAARAPQSYN